MSDHAPLTIPNPRMVGNELPGPHRAIFPHKVIFPRPEYGLPENFVCLMVLWKGTNQNGTDQRRNKSHCTSVSQGR